MKIVRIIDIKMSIKEFTIWTFKYGYNKYISRSIEARKRPGIIKKEFSEAFCVNNTKKVDNNRMKKKFSKSICKKKCKININIKQNSSINKICLALKLKLCFAK